MNEMFSQPLSRKYIILCDLYTVLKSHYYVPDPEFPAIFFLSTIYRNGVINK